MSSGPSFVVLGYGDVGPGDQIQSLVLTYQISYITPGPEIESELVLVLWPCMGMGVLNLMTRFSLWCCRVTLP